MLLDTSGADMPPSIICSVRSEYAGNIADVLIYFEIKDVILCLILWFGSAAGTKYQIFERISDLVTRTLPLIDRFH